MAVKTPVAILGLGLMGSGMASRLLSQNFDVIVYNRSSQKAEALLSLGATVVKTPREAAARAMFVISMVADDDAARSVWLAPDGALNGVRLNAVLIESSTISVQWAKELSASAQARGCELLDAPVTGSKTQSSAGELTFLVGGLETALARARPVLAAMSKDIHYLGPSGSGALMKLINNFICGVQAVALAEGIALIEKTTLDAGKAVAVMTGGAPGSPLVKLLSQRMMARDFTPNFALNLMAKDLKYAIEEGRIRSMPLATASAAFQVMQNAIGAGLGEKDFSSAVELLRL